MTATIEGQHLRVTFAYEADLAALMRRFGWGRWWDRVDRAYVVPDWAVEDAHLDELRRRGFEVF